LSLEQAVDALAAQGKFLLGVDFDGTLAPIVDHPDDAVPDARAVDLLRALATRPNVGVAVISGRALDDLRARLGEVAGATLVGEHGNDVGEPHEVSDSMHDAREFVDWLDDLIPAATVEKKQRSVAFHTRNLSPDQRDSAVRAIREWATGRHGITLLEGKEVYELSTATRDKGDAIEELAQGRPVIYIGDDTTDETVFAMLGPDDVGVKVGGGVTAASHRVKDIDGVVTILEQIALASR
jgi:trehalose-phosphatase